jgi:hypothetical protein
VSTSHPLKTLTLILFPFPSSCIRGCGFRGSSGVFTCKPVCVCLGSTFGWFIISRRLIRYTVALRVFVRAFVCACVRESKIISSVLRSVCLCLCLRSESFGFMWDVIWCYAMWCDAIYDIAVIVWRIRLDQSRSDQIRSDQYWAEQSGAVQCESVVFDFSCRITHDLQSC